MRDKMDTPLLKTKLYIPPVRPGLVPRPHLVERLNAGLNRKLTLISAPTGFGKTTLVAEWLECLKPTPGRGPAGGADKARASAWLSLDEDDNDPARFFTYLIAALETVQADVGADTRALLQSPQHPPLKAVLTLLINSLATMPTDFVLVLDDYHVIEQQSIHDALAFLLDHLPPQMHLVIASRADPPLPLARLRTRSQLTELRPADLRFTPDEAAAFLNQTMGLGLSPGDVAALEARTEGWIAGLQLAALALQSPRPRPDVAAERAADFIAAFSGSHRHVIDYLAEEVMARQPAEIRDFLCQTAILDRLTAPLCDVVTGRDDSDAILGRLEQANLFLVPLDDRREWYRYHHLFADFLRNRLRQDQPDRVPELHRRASAWYEQSGFMEAAIDHALSAEDFERAAHLIEQAAEAAMMRSEVSTVRGWVEALPDDIVRARPLLYVYHAGVQLLDGGPLDVVEARLQEAMEADTAGSISGGVAVVRAFMAAHKGDTRQSTELSRQALELLPENSLCLRSLVAGFLGLNYLYSGDVIAASRALNEAVRIGQKVGNLLTTVIALCNLAELSVLQGQLYQAQAFYNKALEMGVDGQGRPRPLAGMALIGLGQLLREWNDLEAATRRLLEGIELTRKWGEVGPVQGYVGLALVKQAQGDTEGARQAIQTAQQLAIEFDATAKDVIFVAVCQVRLSVAQGNIEAATRWVEERGLDRDISREELEKEASNASLPLHRALEYIAFARLCIAQGRSGEALEVLKPLLQAAETAGWTGLVIEILMLQSLALRAQGDGAQALTTLERALSLAEPEGYARIFIDEGAPMAELLSALDRQRSVAKPLQKYISKLLSACELEGSRLRPEGLRPEFRPRAQPAGLQVEGVSVSQPSLLEPLSERELEVLRLVAAGLSNREIADRLIITLGTAKRHINNIYAKLDVHSRVQAVARAQDLHLL
jgi:LuxR family maltose regulon positive regulatory protein